MLGSWLVGVEPSLGSQRKAHPSWLGPRRDQAGPLSFLSWSLLKDHHHACLPLPGPTWGQPLRKGSPSPHPVPNFLSLRYPSAQCSDWPQTQGSSHILTCTLRVHTRCAHTCTRTLSPPGRLPLLALSAGCCPVWTGPLLHDPELHGAAGHGAPPWVVCSSVARRGWPQLSPFPRPWVHSAFPALTQNRGRPTAPNNPARQFCLRREWGGALLGSTRCWHTCF